jgi:hypothetical protein
MSEGLLLENRFLHVWSRDLVAPFVVVFSTGAWLGRENSVVLREQMRPAQTAATLSLGDQALLDEFSAACREAVLFAERILTDQYGELPPELQALANQAAEECAARQQEDVQSWAEQLARDVGNATD